MDERIMRMKLPSYKPLLSVALCLISMRVIGAPAGVSTNIGLPSAHSGQPYMVHVYLPTTFVPGWIEYSLNPAPHWLVFDSATSMLTGTPDESTAVTYTGITLTLKSTADPQAKPQVFHLTLPVVAG